MRQKPSILFVNRVLYPEQGETGRVLRDLVRAFSQDGWDVRTVSLYTGKKHEYPSQKIHIKTARAFLGKSFLGYVWAWIRLLILALRQPRTDIVVTMTDPPLLVCVGYFISLIKGARHVHWCQDVYPDLFPVLGYPKFLKHLTNGLSGFALRRCDKVVVIGRCMARKIADKKVMVSKITVIPNWYNPAQGGANTIKTKKPRLKKNVKAPKKQQDLILDETQKFRVLYAGTIGRGHDVSTIFDAAKTLQEKAPDVEFVFVGNQSAHEKILKAKNDYGLNNIRCIPYQPESELKPLMESGDVHIVSLKEDATGLMMPSKFYSAIAAHRPTIFLGSNGCEIANVIRDFDCGTIIVPKDVKGLVNTIDAYRNDENTWFTHQAGAVDAAQRFIPEQSWQVWLQRMQKLMREP